MAAAVAAARVAEGGAVETQPGQQVVRVAEVVLAVAAQAKEEGAKQPSVGPPRR